MTKVFSLPFIYSCQGIPPRHRVQQSFYASDTALFSFPEADPSELEPALAFYHAREDADGKRIENETLIRKCRGMLVRPVPANERAFDGNSLDEERLAAFAAGVPPRQLPEVLWGDHRYAYAYSSPTIYPTEALTKTRITRNGRQDAIAAIQTKIESSLTLVDGVLYGRVQEPSFNLHIWGGRPWTAEALLRPTSSFAIPGDQPELVEEFGKWCSERFGKELTLRSDTRIEVLSTEIPMDENPIVRAALGLADRAELNIVNVDYFGAETKSLGQALRSGPSVSGSLAFVEAFQEAATKPEAHALGGDIDNADWFELFWKFYEIMPETYKIDAGDETFAVDGPDAGLSM